MIEKTNARTLNDMKVMRSVLLMQGTLLDKGGPHPHLDRRRLHHKVKQAMERHDALIETILMNNQAPQFLAASLPSQPLNTDSTNLQQPSFKAKTINTQNGSRSLGHFNHFMLGLPDAPIARPTVSASTTLSLDQFPGAAEAFSSSYSLIPGDSREEEQPDVQNNRAHRNWRDAAHTLHCVIRIGINRGLMGPKSDDSMGTLALIDLVKSCSTRAREYRLKSQHADKQSSVTERLALQILVKPSMERSDTEIKTVMSFISYWPYFQRFSPSVRQELCQIAELEVFNTGKRIVAEGRRAVYRYILVEGIAEIVRSNRSEFRSQKQSDKSDEVARGQSFDSWTSDAGYRTASIICLTPVKVLRIDLDAFEGAVERARQAEGKMKYEFLRNLELLRVFNDFEVKKLAEYCQVKIIPSGTTILRESEGECRVVKVHEVRFPTGHHRQQYRKSNRQQDLLPPQQPHYEQSDFQQQPQQQPPQVPSTENNQSQPTPSTPPSNTLQSASPQNFSPLSHSQQHQSSPPPPPPQQLRRLHKRAIGRLLTIQKLSPGDFFGETGTFAMSKRQGLSGMQSKDLWKSAYSVVTNTKSIVLMLSKIDLINICSDDNFEKLRKDTESRQINPQETSDSYSINLKWQQFQQEVIGEVVAEQESRNFSNTLAAAEHQLKVFNGFSERL